MSLFASKLAGRFALATVISGLASVHAFAADCKGLPSWKAMKAALLEARSQDNGGFNLDMWGAVVSRDGDVCGVAFTGADRGSQWPGSRVISVQKAVTANAFSLPKLALSTANLYAAVQPGGSLFGLQHSNPVRADIAYAGDAKRFGQENDPLVGKRPGGVNVFGGGLALYDKNGVLLGALGVSGDSSCADHNIAWRARKTLGLDYVPGGVGPDGTDNISYLADKETPTGFKHPGCGGKETGITLPPVAKKG